MPPPPLSSSAGIVVRHVAHWAIYACSIVQAKRVCLKFEAPTVLSIFQIYAQFGCAAFQSLEGSIDPRCVEKHHWMRGRADIPPAKAKQRCYAMLE